MGKLRRSGPQAPFLCLLSFLNPALFSSQPVLPLLFPPGPAFDRSAAASTDHPHPPFQVWNSPCWHLSSCDSLQMLCIPGYSAGFGSPLWLQALGKLKVRRKAPPPTPTQLPKCCRKEREIVRKTGEVLCRQDRSQLFGPAGNSSGTGRWREAYSGAGPSPREAHSHIQKHYPPSGDHLHLSGKDVVEATLESR